MTIRHQARRGAYRLLHRLTGPGRSIRVISLYHSVGVDAPHSLPTAAFHRHLDFLRRQFTVVKLSELAETMATQPDARVACITFDDGYADNYEVALPLLESLGLKATFFVTTGYLGGEFPTSFGRFPAMTAAQVKEMARLGHEVGAHTVSHPKLSEVPLATAREEMERSKHWLEDLIGAEVGSFAYPKGAYDDGVKTLAATLGFRGAVTTRSRLVGPHPDWFALPRVWIGRHITDREFEAKLSPATDWYDRLRWPGTGETRISRSRVRAPRP
jgi:peptidoglycan/xylan/chitin deacetylase (PgdA/CDA1 family)